MESNHTSKIQFMSLRKIGSWLVIIMMLATPLTTFASALHNSSERSAVPVATLTDPPIFSSPAMPDERSLQHGSRDYTRPTELSLTVAVVHVAAPVNTSRVERMISSAMAQRGKPYVFGSVGPRSYDCSGLIVHSFLAIGVHLPHFTGDLLGLGTRVSKSAMRRGDLVFPSSHHVGIYLGGGLMVVAPHSGTVVQVQKVYAFYTARRLL